MRVAVIGHGPSPRGMGWGEQIDSCDFVIRMFDCAWQESADYGTRYDAGVVTMSYRSLRWFTQEATRKPKSWWVHREAGAWFPFSTAAPQAFMDTSEFRDSGLSILKDHKIAHNPSLFSLTRGTAAACWAIKTLSPHTLIMVGFDEVMSGQYTPEPYSPECLASMARRADFFEIKNALSQRPVSGLTKSDGHDMTVERLILAHAARDYSVDLFTAQDVW